MSDFSATQPAHDAVMLSHLREAGSYLLTHRKKLFVLLVHDTMRTNGKIQQLLADLMLLRHLTGARLVLAYDVLGPDSTGPVNDARMAEARGRSNLLRELIERQLTQGASVSVPKVDILSGNLVTARKMEAGGSGGRNWHGENTKIDIEKASRLIDEGILLLPPFGVSRGGEMLHVSGKDVACVAASRLIADKLIVFVSPEVSSWLDFSALTVSGVEDWLADKSGRFRDSQHAAGRLLRMAARTVSSGTNRAHFINEETDGGLLLELLSPEGIGSMVTNVPFENVRPAAVTDVQVIFELISSPVREDKLLPRTIDELREQIGTFAVVAHDDYVVACASMCSHGAKSAELRCLAVRPGHTELSWGEMLLGYFEDKARAGGIKRMLVVTTRARGWFVQHGYAAADILELPEHRRESVSGPRHAKILGKSLSHSNDR